MKDSVESPLLSDAVKAAGQSGPAAIDPSAIADLAAELVRIDTTNPPGGELAAACLLGQRLEDAGLEVALLPFDDGRANLIARIRGQGRRASLLLSGHLDTVPVSDPDRWTVSPHGAEVHGSRLYGRGALDMKGSVAAMAVAATSVAASGMTPAGDIVLAFTAGEETDSCGADRICVEGHLDDVGMAIIGEPTDLDIGIGHRGAFWIRVETEGQAGHGSQPALGRNAINELLGWLPSTADLEELVHDVVDPVLGSGSVSLNMIGGGVSPNVIPTRAHAVIDFRTVPGSDHRRILAGLKSRLESASFTILRDAPPITVPEGHPLVKAAETSVAAICGRPAAKRGLPYVTDGSKFVEHLGIPALILGPGTEYDAHTDDESIEISSLHQAAEIYRLMIRELMSETLQAPREESVR